MSDFDTAALRQLLADATTAGPWDVHELYTRDEYVVCGGEDAYAVGTVWSYPDAELIAALRNHAPALLSALATVTAERDEARRERDTAREKRYFALVDLDELRRDIAGLTRWADGDEREDVPAAEIRDVLRKPRWYAAAPKADPSCVCTVDIRDGRIIDREASCPQHGAAAPGDGEQAATTCGSAWTSRWAASADHRNIVLCTLPAGHDGDHAEPETDSYWDRNGGHEYAYVMTGHPKPDAVPSARPETTGDNEQEAS